jgi:3-oxoacyl-[acyl-carrier-protein] synthase II
MSHRRVAITGLGWVTSLGTDVAQVWQDLCQGRSGIKPITRFDTARFTSRIAGEVRDWEGGPNIDRREAKRLDRFTQFALNAAIDAAHDAGIDFDQYDPFRCGSIIGTGIGGIEEFETGFQRMADKGPDRVSPFMVPKLMCNAGCGNVSIHFGLKGPNVALVSACASAAHAIGDAFDAIRMGRADVMITGGSEAAVTPIGVASFMTMRALSTRNDEPERASRPWDRDRDGFVLAEGAGILVLEELEAARQRGARIYAEMIGYGQSADGSHITAPDEQGTAASYAMKASLDDAGVGPADVSYINAHGTSTELGDVAETRAIKRTFGDHAARTPVSSTKSMTGHLLGATGGVEAIIVALAVHHDTVPPTINLDNPDDECDLDYVPHEARELPVNVAMSNSFGFGGHNVCLVVAKPDR